MFEEILSSGTLNLVYLGMLVLSFFFALLTLIGSEIGDIFDFDVDVDADGGLDFISVSPFAMAMFGATFGLAGLITRIWFEMDPIPSILWALGVGMVAGVAAQAFFFYVLSPSTSSHYRLESSIVGREAEVITSIPAEGLGEIAFNNVSGRVKLGARSAQGEPIPYVAIVRVNRIVGRVAIVQPSEAEVVV